MHLGVARPPASPGDRLAFERVQEHRLFDRLPDETWFYSGHGKDSALGDERPAKPEWHACGW